MSLCSVWSSIGAIKGGARVFCFFFSFFSFSGCCVIGIGMHSSKKSGQGGDGEVEARPVRTSDRLRRRPKVYGRTYLYYNANIIRTRKGKGKNKTRTAASQIAKMLCVRAPNNDVSDYCCWHLLMRYMLTTSG